MMAELKRYREVVRILKKARTVAMSVHMFPDGDALGSMIALALMLKRMGKQVRLFSPSALPQRYAFLPLFSRIRMNAPAPQAVDVAIAVDCASRAQLGELDAAIFSRARTVVEIDHHDFRQSFGDCQLIDRKAAAVGEIIYHLGRIMRSPLDRLIATALLVSIVVETGSFRLPTVRRQTFLVCAELVSCGVDFYHLVEKSYWSRSPAEARLLGLCFSSMKFFKGGRVAYVYISLADLRKTGATDEDADPVADQIRTLRDVKVVALFREMNDGRLRVSLRSKSRVNVGRIAEEFGGGGHPDVAGCYLDHGGRRQRELLARVLKSVS